MSKCVLACFTTREPIGCPKTYSVGTVAAGMRIRWNRSTVRKEFDTRSGRRWRTYVRPDCDRSLGVMVCPKQPRSVATIPSSYSE